MNSAIRQVVGLAAARRQQMNSILPTGRILARVGLGVVNPNPVASSTQTTTTQTQTRSITTRFALQKSKSLGESSSSNNNNSTTRRLFNSEGEYHTFADETLEDLQDAVENALESANIPEFEITFASGVMTMVMPPHGIWVINKQSPNQQLWWSSPLSGPRRYEYQDGEWVYTRADESHSMTLAQTLQEEIKQIYQVEIEV
jgi:frataxin